MCCPALRLWPLACAAALVLAGCKDSGSPVQIDATGTAIGLAYLDQDGDGKPGGGDVAVQGVRVALVRAPGGDEVAHAITNAQGTYAMRGVPVGRYQLVVDSGTVGDTLSIARVDSALVTLAAGDTARSYIALGYPSTDPAAVRALPAGRKVQLDGIALNAWSAFGDSTLHVYGAGVAVRALRVSAASLYAGDSVRLLGTTSTDGGQVVLTGVQPRVLATGRALPAADSLATGRAAGADGGRLDAGLARIAGATILSFRVLGNGDFAAAVDDGSGVLDVIITPRSNIQADPAFALGSLVDATGLLVPGETRGSWGLRPRETRDLKVSFRSATIAGIRTLPIGRTVQVEGIALNPWIAFGDSTVHIADATGTLRAVQVRPANVFTGDSVRMAGTVMLRDGQVVLGGVQVTMLASGKRTPEAVAIALATAASADGGHLDAALVRVSGTIADTSTDHAGDHHLRLAESGDTLAVVLDRELGLALRPYLPGVKLEVTGLLVPLAGGGSWLLKPREARDLVILP